MNFSDRLVSQLLDNEFQALHENGDWEALPVFFVKPIGAIFYFIAIIDGQDSPAHADNVFENCRTFYKDICTRSVYIQIILSEQTEEIFKNYADKPFLPESSIHKIYWVVDIRKNLILIPEGTPSEILNIKRMIQNSFSGNEAAPLPHLAKKSANTIFTMILVCFNISTFLWTTFVFGQRSMFDAFALNPYDILVDKQYYRIITSAFLHADMRHIAYNSLSIYIFGARVEKYFGKLSFVIIYFVSVLFSGIWSVLFSRSISVGASGGAFGLIAATFILSVKKKKSIGQMDKNTIFMMLASGLLMGLLTPNIDNYAHLGGVIGGGLAGLICVQKN